MDNIQKKYEGKQKQDYAINTAMATISNGLNRRICEDANFSKGCRYKGGVYSDA